MTRVISLMGLCIALLAGSFVERSAWGQDPAQKNSGAIPSGEDENPETPQEEMSDHWEGWEDIRVALDQERHTDAMASLDRLRKHHLEHGILNDPAVAWVLLRAAEQAGEKDNYLQALELIRYAREFAPALPAPYFMSARLYWNSDVRSFGEMVGDLTTGLSRGWAFLPTRMAWLSKGLKNLLVVWLVVFVFFSIGIGIRYVRLLAHDIRIRLPTGILEKQALAFTILVLLFPLAMGVGFVYVALFWIMAHWVYLKVGERWTAVVLLFGFVFFPKASATSIAAEGYGGTWIGTAYDCSIGVCDGEDLDVLEEVAETLGGDAQLTLALYYQRKSAVDFEQLERAKRYMARTETVLRENADAAVVRGSFLMVQAARDCDTKALVAHKLLRKSEQEFGQALDWDSGHLAALYNASVLARLQGKKDEADAFYVRAQEVDADRIHEFERETVPSELLRSCPAGMNMNRYLMMPRPSTDDYATLVLDAEISETMEMGLPLEASLFGRWGLGHFYKVIWGAFVIMFGLLGVRRVVDLAWSCEGCSRVASARGRPELKDLGICDACLTSQITGSAMDPKAHWIRERQMRVKNHRVQLTGRAVSFFVPGLGLLLRGRAAWGAVLLFCFLFCVVLAVEPMFGAVGIWSFDMTFSWVKAGCFGILGAVVYLINLVSIYSIREGA